MNLNEHHDAGAEGGMQNYSDLLFGTPSHSLTMLVTKSKASPQHGRGATSAPTRATAILVVSTVFLKPISCGVANPVIGKDGKSRRDDVLY